VVHEDEVVARIETCKASVEARVRYRPVCALLLAPRRPPQCRPCT
jgi:hypothetical protein